MDPATELIVGGTNLALVAACVWVGVALNRRGVNGACRLCLVLLGAERVSDVSLQASGMARGTELWHWTLGTLFACTFLYVLYHIGELIAQARRGSAQDRRAACRGPRREV